MDPFPRIVLLATDGSEDAELAARIAADVATTTGREVHVVHVFEPLPRYAYPGITPEIYSLVYDKRRAQAGDLLAREADRLRSEGDQRRRGPSEGGSHCRRDPRLGRRTKGEPHSDRQSWARAGQEPALGQRFGGSGAPLQASHIGRSRRAASLAS